ncbi:MAG TPA: alpha-(1-_3)-arabinofuranosyltransferase family protein [Acidimicrobiales bacterium]|nr:alpha-(1->3)-arabinofuranosyltransferase family protein [Acidimicrobiales bacterium]
MTTANATATRRVSFVDLVVLTATSILPLILRADGRLNADTKQYLYLDPGGLLHRSLNLWDPAIAGGTVSHQQVGYLWPMGPFYWLMDVVGLPDWAAQRIWVGLIQLVAGLGALVLFRTLLPHHRAQLVGALAYGLSPFVLGHITGQSALLLPFSALPWLVWCVTRTLDEGGWRWPATFALIVTSCGSLNGSSVFFVLLGACLWIPYAVWWQREITWRDGWRALWHMGLLTVFCQLWWLVAYSIGGKYGLPILAVTENVRATSSSTSAAEIVRGLGYWFFYGRDPARPWLDGIAPPYQTSRLLIGVTFALPVIALLFAASLRWRARHYFALLIAVGTVIAVGAFAKPTRSPAGAAFEDASRNSDLVLSLRNTQRAAPLVALGMAAFIAAGLSALSRRQVHVAGASALVIVVFVFGALPAQWSEGLIAPRFSRGEIPQYWLDAARALDEGNGRILELPGIDFASYRWGHTLDPITPGLVDRPFIARELVPVGSAPGVSLLSALDRSIQEGWFEPATLATVARLLGATDIVVRNDLEYERYRTVRPQVLWPQLTAAPGLSPPQAFGPRLPNVAAADRPLIDEIQLALDPNMPAPPEVAIFAVQAGARAMLSAIATGAGTVIDGDGEGVLAATAAGLMDLDRLPLLLGGDVASSAAKTSVGAGTRYIVTDSNRKRAGRWYALRDNVGATEQADSDVVLDDISDARLPVVDDEPANALTVIELRGAERVWASSYGSVFTLTPEERPMSAFDGDSRTSWRVDLPTAVSAPLIGIELGREISVDAIELLDPIRRPGTQLVTRARITLDGTRDIDVILPAERGDEPMRVALDGKPFHQLEITVLDAVNTRDGSAGFSEIQIPGVRVEELTVLPTAVLDLLGSSAANAPLAFTLSRQRANPAEPVRTDPELSMRRILDLPAPSTLTLGGTARVSAGADEIALDRLLGWARSGVAAVRSSERLAGAITARASSAIDGSTSTVWSTPFVGISGQTWEAAFTSAITLNTLELDIVTDEHHSQPRSVTLRVGSNDPVQLSLPALPVGALGSTGHVSLPLPRPLAGDTMQLTIDDYDARTTPDWYSGTALDFPVAVAEIGLPLAAPAAVSTRIDTGCRSDLVTIDGATASVRIEGDSGPTHRDTLTVTPCGSALSLAAGRHEIATAIGLDSGFDIDRLVLRSSNFDQPAAASGTTTPVAPTVTIDSHRTTSVKGTVQTDGAPFWLVLDQSINKGWHVDMNDAQVDGPHPIDSFANGWLITPEHAGTFSVHVRWTPQRNEDLALIVSALAVVSCLVLALRRPWRPIERAPDAPTFIWPRERAAVETARPGRARIAIAFVVGALFIHPIAGVAMAVLFAAQRGWPGRAWVLHYAVPAGIAAAAAQVLVWQTGYRHEPGGAWPQQFAFAHVISLFVIVMMGLLAGPEPRRDTPV